MQSIFYIDRLTRKKEEEQVYGKQALSLFYGKKPLLRFLLPLLTQFSFMSHFYGWLQKLSLSKKKIPSFIKKFNIDPSEFVKRIEEFTSFNDFFIRHLKPSSRPLATADALIFADGRYLFYPDLSQAEGIWVKGEKFSLAELLKDDALAKKYQNGSMVMARLCPTDYHRFHFPCDCIPETSQLINGSLYSVNPCALKENIHILTQNKRVLTLLKTRSFGDVLFIEVGATHVGSIHQTYTPHKLYKKGDEKGYFSFGGSCIILLFQKGSIHFDEDLMGHEIEVKGLLGQSMGKACK